MLHVMRDLLFLSKFSHFENIAKFEKILSSKKVSELDFQIPLGALRNDGLTPKNCLAKENPHYMKSILLVLLMLRDYISLSPTLEV